MDTASTEAHSLCVVNLFLADLFILGQNCSDLQRHEDPGRSKSDVRGQKNDEKKKEKRKMALRLLRL